MKLTSFILSIVSIVAVIVMAIVGFSSPAVEQASPAAGDSTVVSAGKGDFVYLQLDRVVTEYDKYNDMMSAIETKAQGIQNDITRRGQLFENEVTTFQNKVSKVSKGLMTRSVAEAQQEELMKKEQELNIYVGQKQQEIQDEQIVMTNTIMEDIKNFVARYNQDKGYSLILTTSEATNTIILGNASIDITDAVIAGLNEEYTRTKNK